MPSTATGVGPMAAKGAAGATSVNEPSGISSSRVRMRNSFVPVDWMRASSWPSAP